MNSLSVIIVGCLLAALYHGYQIGFVRSLIRLVGRLAVFMLATVFARPLGVWLAQHVIGQVTTKWVPSGTSTWLDGHWGQFFATGIVFSVVVALGLAIVRSLERSMRFINRIPLLGLVNRLAGVFVYGLLVYIELFLVLFITQALPIPWYHQALVSSNLAQWMLDQTPYLSQQLYQYWLLQH